MSGEIVKYRNELNMQPLKLNATEQDVFIAIISRLRDHGPEPVTFTYDELRALTQDRSNTATRFRATVQKVYDKIYDTKCVIDTPHKYKVFHIFHTYEIDKDAETVTISIENDFVPYLNDFVSGNWTRFVLAEFTNLKSKYSKTLFRLLKQWRTKGICIIMIDDFRSQMTVPKSYNMGNIDEKVLRPALKELQDVFPGLKCDKVYEHHHRGRPSVSGFQFTWKPEHIEKQPASKPKGSKYAEAVQKCPRCGRALVQRKINGSLAWVHPDGKSGGICDALYNTVEEIRQERIKKDKKTDKENNPDMLTPEETKQLAKQAKEKLQRKQVDTNPRTDENKQRQAKQLCRLVGNKPMIEMGVRKLCSQLDVAQTSYVDDDIASIADMIGYRVEISEKYADGIRPKKLRLLKK